MWLDEWVIQPGDSIPLAIEQRLESSRTLVLVMSQTPFVSESVTLERYTALVRDPTNGDDDSSLCRLDDCDIKDLLNRLVYVAKTTAPSRIQLSMQVAESQKWIQTIGTRLTAFCG